MKYLILGSAGQIGAELTKYLRNKGDEVITHDIVDDKASQDLRIRHSVGQYIESCDFIFFLAFDVGGSRYLQKYQHTFEFIDNNIKLMSNTFEYIKHHNKPFIFASSQMSNMSYSPYGILKAVGETYTKILNGIVVKFWNVYGVEHDLEKSHVITDFILSAKNNHQINMMTDGQEERQMLHAKDCCECLEILANKYESISREEELHVTSFEWSKIIDIANIIAESFPETVVNPAIAKDNVELNKRNEPSEDILKYWKPKITLREGIENIIGAYK
jgi:nucleoside-diphosphate-sugar epimerase